MMCWRTLNIISGFTIVSVAGCLGYDVLAVSTGYMVVSGGNIRQHIIT
jgi:hypothetical protein